MAIKRVWHGWTTKENADKYQDILNKDVLLGIEAKRIPGYKKIANASTDDPGVSSLNNHPNEEKRKNLSPLAYY